MLQGSKPLVRSEPPRLLQIPTGAESAFGPACAPGAARAGAAGGAAALDGGPARAPIDAGGRPSQPVRLSRARGGDGSYLLRGAP
eukprot:7143986-Prymnesium_polylepis.1